MATKIRRDIGGDELFQQIVNDERLSFTARGVGTYLVKQPDESAIDIGELISRAPNDAWEVIEALVDLLRFGYIERTPEP